MTNTGKLHTVRGRAIVALTILAVAATALLLLGRAGAAASPSASTDRTVTVTMAHFKFLPKSLSVGKGTTVVFSNQSKVKHTATLKGSFDTGKIKPGHAVSVRFTAKGTYHYICTIHPDMKGTIVVG